MKDEIRIIVLCCASVFVFVLACYMAFSFMHESFKTETPIEKCECMCVDED